MPAVHKAPDYVVGLVVKQRLNVLPDILIFWRNLHTRQLAVSDWIPAAGGNLPPCGDRKTSPRASSLCILYF